MGLHWPGKQENRKGHLMWPRCEAPSLGFAYTEYRGSAFRADTLGGRALVLQGDLLCILDFHLLLAFHAVRLCHSFQPPSTKICAEAITCVNGRQYGGGRVDRMNLKTVDDPLAHSARSGGKTSGQKWRVSEHGFGSQPWPRKWTLCCTVPCGRPL